MALNKIIIGLIVSGLFTSCSLITEPDIEDSIVNLRAPADSTITYTLTQTFFWDRVEDANGYNLQVVKPSFNSIAEIVLDTNLSTNSFVFALVPGQYEWGVYAYNSGYSTYQSVFSLTIESDTSDNLANQRITISSSTPKITNKLIVTFAWEPLTMANYFIVSVRDSTFKNEYTSEMTHYDTVSVKLPEGKYEWGVQGHNDHSTTAFYHQALIVDTTDPGNPEIIVPENDGDTINVSPYIIEWRHTGASLSAISDNVYVSTDSLFRTNTKTYISTSLTQSLDDLSNNRYFVRIKSIDAAGNSSGFSTTRKFILHK